MLKIVSFTICPFVQRVTALLEAKNIPYEIEFIRLSDKPQWFLDISPNGQVPVLITDNGTPLFESEAIVEYIEEAYAPLRANIAPEEKALERAWSALASKQYLVQCSAQRSASAELLAERSAKLGQALDKIEARLTGSRFFAGDTPGLVDIAWLVLLHRADIINRHTGYDFFGNRPKLKAWQHAILATGLAKKSVAPEFQKAFTDFYLSESTYLGRGCDATGATGDTACNDSTCC